MRVRFGHKTLTLVVVGALAAYGLVLLPGWASPAQAASFAPTPATRLYMAPQGTTLLAGLAGVPIGTLAFDGATDVISQDLRNIDVAAEIGPLGCDTVTDQAVGVIDYNLDDCPRIQFDVIHGRLKLPDATQVLRDYLSDPDGAGPLVAGDPDPSDVVWRLPDGAVISQIGGGGSATNPNDPAGHVLYHLSGTDAQINAALDTLTYIPDDGYYYTNSPPEERLAMLLVSGDPAGASSNHTIEIRVLDVNDAASLDGPAAKNAQPEIELAIPPLAPPTSFPYTGSEWTVADVDNDEIIDTDTGDPGELPDGADNKMLLVGYLDCGQPTTDEQTGFHFRGGTFQADNLDIEDLLTDFYDLTTAPAEVQTAVDGLLAALDALAPGLINVPLATSDPFIYNDTFAGIGDIDNVAFALSQVFFLSNAELDTCTLWTVVSDLGNNGLPLQYIGDPPTGVEIPFLGVPPIDIVETTIQVGQLQEITVNFDFASQFVLEGTTAEATLTVSPATHPAFDVRWSTIGVSATANSDFGSITDATITVAENATTVVAEISTNAFNDSDPEMNETFIFNLTTPTDPPYPTPVGPFVRPFGWEVTSTQSTQSVTIIDNDSGDRAVQSVSNPAVGEGDAGTATATFVITLDGPAAGTETVTVATADGSATDANNDYEPVVAQVVSFALGQTTAQVTVTVNGDTSPEANETFTLELSSPVNLTLSDGSGAGTITNDDGVPDVSVDDVAIAEGHAGTSVAQFEVSLSDPALGGEQITVATASGTGTAPSDFSAVAATVLTFAAGETTKTVDVTVNGDPDAEPDETFTVNLTSPANLSVADGQGVGTITNDDITISIEPAAAVPEGSAGAIDVMIEPATHPAFEVAVSSTDVTSEAGDYQAIAATLAIGLNSGSQPLAVTANQDVDQNDETLDITIAPPAAPPAGFAVRVGSGAGTGTVTIIDDDVPLPTLSVADAVVVEGSGAGTTLIELVVSTSALYPVECGFRAVLTHVSTSDGDLVTGPVFFDVTAVWDTDDQDIPRSFGIARDVIDESNETFTLTLTPDAAHAVPCVIGDGAATGTITDDDVPLPTLSVADAVVVEGSGAGTTLIELVVSTSALYPVECGFRAVLTHVSTSDGDLVTGPVFFDVTAVWDTDDQDIPRSFGIARDVIDESNETFTLTLTPDAAHAVPCVIGDGAATGTITDDDGAPPDLVPPTVTIDQAVGQADPTGGSPIQFSVVFSEDVTGFVTGDVTLSGSSGATTATVEPSADPRLYTVNVTGMTNSGLVIATIAAGAAQDGAGNPSGASTSADNSVSFTAVAPLTLVLPGNISRNNDPGQAGAIVTFNVTASGGVPPIVVTCVPPSGSFFGTGTTTVQCHATDAESSPQQATAASSFTVTIINITSQPPILDNPTGGGTGSSGAVGGIGGGGADGAATNSTPTGSANSSGSAAPPAVLAHTGSSTTDLTMTAISLIFAGLALNGEARRRRRS